LGSTAFLHKLWKPTEQLVVILSDSLEFLPAARLFRRGRLKVGG